MANCVILIGRMNGVHGPPECAENRRRKLRKLAGRSPRRVKRPFWNCRRNPKGMAPFEQVGQNVGKTEARTVVTRDPLPFLTSFLSFLWPLSSNKVERPTETMFQMSKIRFVIGTAMVIAMVGIGCLALRFSNSRIATSVVEQKGVEKGSGLTIDKKGSGLTIDIFLGF